jgi:hypothetical protein
MRASWFETPRKSAAPHHEDLSPENHLIPRSIASAMRLEGWAQRSLCGPISYVLGANAIALEVSAAMHDLCIG